MRPTAGRVTVVLCALAGVAVVAAGLGSAGAATSPKVALPTTPMSAEDAAKLNTQIESVFKPLGPDIAPGLWVGVWDAKKGAYEKAFGQAVRGSTPATTADSFRIGSITKTFTATIILQLVAQGKLTLGETVAKADPDLAQRFPALGKLTIAQLLGMTSGITDYLNVPHGLVAQIAKNPTKPLSADQLIAAGIRGGVKKAGTPGYSTTNYIALQEIAEKITRKPLPVLIAQQITRPLGMRKTALPANNDARLPAPATHGYLNKDCVMELKFDGGSAKLWQDTSHMHNPKTGTTIAVATNACAGSSLLFDAIRKGAQEVLAS